MIQVIGSLHFSSNLQIYSESATPPIVTTFNTKSNRFFWTNLSMQQRITSVPIEKPSKVIWRSEKWSIIWSANSLPVSVARLSESQNGLDYFYLPLYIIKFTALKPRLATVPNRPPVAAVIPLTAKDPTPSPIYFTSYILELLRQTIP